MFLSKMMGNKVLHAPIDITATRVLDIGCGTGIVTHLISDTYPQATCIGLDLSETPRLRPQAANVQFFKGNATVQRPTQWTTARGKPTLPQDESLFDYVFSRLLILGMSDWQSFLKIEYSLLRPGGWAEVHDLAWDWYDADGTVVSNEWSWLRCIRQELEKGKGMDLDCGKKAKAWMVEAGFVDVQVYKYIYPFCGSSESSLEMREFGLFNTTAVPVMLDDVIPRVMGNACSDEKELLRADMRRTLLAGKEIHQVFFVTVGRKPFAFERDTQIPCEF
jgi:SAM-dependent methyltransferase